MWRNVRYVIREFGYFPPSLKRGTWVLVGIIILLQIILWMFKHVTRHYRHESEAMVLLTADSIVAVRSQTAAIGNPINTDEDQVDPNTASVEEIVKMGFPSYIARRFVRYREMGGMFYNVSDICKIYGIDTVLVYRWKKKWVFPQPMQVSRENRVVIGRIEINRADTMTLEKLPGIGKVLAVRIIKYRELLGGYYSVEQLREIYGLSAEAYQRISSILWADSSCIRPLSISTVSFRGLARHPYIGLELAKKMDTYRKLKVQVSLGKLLQDSIITPQQAERLRRYCDFSSP